jgi:hypothetical protein
MNKLLRILAFAAPLAFVAACGGGNDLEDRLDVADPKMRFVHAVPAGPNVSLFREQAAQSDATDVPYRYNSDYFDIETGVATWSLTTATGGVGLGSVGPFDYARGNRYTIVAVASATAADLVLIDDPYTRDPASDTARVRVLNGSLNAQNLDVYLTAPGTDLNTVTPNFGAVGFKSAVPASSNNSVEVDGSAVPYQLRVTEAGTKNVLFTASMPIAKNEDWLVITVPNGVTANSVGVLLVKADDPAKTAIELTNSP